MKPTPTEQDSDGWFIGAKGLLAPSTTFPEIQGICFGQNADAIERVLYVNGIMTDVALHLEDINVLAATGCEVIGLHNSTHGLFHDLRECIRDKCNKGSTPAASTLERVMIHALENDITLHLIGHSQGAIIISRALWNVKRQLNLSPVELAQKLSNFQIETYGGGALYYVDGPKYVHIDNKFDPVPLGVGLGIRQNFFFPYIQPGKDAVLHSFSQVNSFHPRKHSLPAKSKKEWVARFIDHLVHGPQSTYFPRRRPFKEMYQGNF